MTQILMVHYGPYLHPLGGGTKADRFILEYLAAKGFRCTAVVPASHSSFEESPCALDPGADYEGVRQVQVNGVDVHVVFERSESGFLRHQRLLEHLEILIEGLPAWIFVTGSDRGHWILKTIVRKTKGHNVVYVPRATAELPKGPYSFIENRSAVQAMAQVHTVFCASRYMADYIRNWCGVEAHPIDVPVYGSPPFPDFGGVGSFITIINPCTIKGIDIFLALAEAHPLWIFAAVPTWGTTQQDRARLSRFRNVVVLDSSPDINVILKQTRILLVPSIWDEAFGMVVVEAMLRGIPVLASDIGGLPEAKLGVPYLLPVQPIVSYDGLDARTRTPLATPPYQNIELWSRALGRLQSDPAHYAAISDTSRSVATAYVAKLDMGLIDRLMNQTRVEAPVAANVASVASTLSTISPARRAALVQRLRARGSTQ